MKVIKRGLVMLLLVVALLAAGLYVLQDSLIYFPRKYDSAVEDAVVQQGGEWIRFGINEGQQAAVLFPSGSKLPRHLWLFSNGNGSQATSWISLIRDRADDNDVGFLLFDYPGYGYCEGSPHPKTILESQRALVKAVAEHYGVEESEVAGRLLGLGHSLGAASTLLASEEFKMRHVVLISPFTSLRDMAKRQIGPGNWLLRHGYDNRKRLQSLVKNEGRATIIHGADDQLIPVSMGQELLLLAPDHVDFFEIKGAGHNDILRAGRGEIVAAMEKAMDESGASQ